jgi:hypothetical protein
VEIFLFMEKEKLMERKESNFPPPMRQNEGDTF